MFQRLDGQQQAPSHSNSKPDFRPLLLQFAIFLSLIVLVEVATAIAGYVYRDKVSRDWVCVWGGGDTSS